MLHENSMWRQWKRHPSRGDTPRPWLDSNSRFLRAYWLARSRSSEDGGATVCSVPALVTLNMKRVTVVPDIPEARRRIMRAIRGRDTGPELTLRKLLYRSGYRFRLHRRDLPGTPDLVFPSRRAAIQVHGCFWHQHLGCSHANIPATRQSYWLPKLARNKQRDLESAERLEAAGWRHLVIWECDLCNPQEVLRSAVAFLGPPGSAANVQTTGREVQAMAKGSARRAPVPTRAEGLSELTIAKLEMKRRPLTPAGNSPRIAGTLRRSNHCRLSRHAASSKRTSRECPSDVPIVEATVSLNRAAASGLSN